MSKENKLTLLYESVNKQSGESKESGPDLKTQ